MEMYFGWSRIGDIRKGRANLGEMMPVSMFRLVQYTILDELTERFGVEMAQEIIRGAGLRAGLNFCRNLLDRTKSFPGFVADLQAKMKEMSIGILRIEKADTEAMQFVMTVSEDLDCSGLPITGNAVCVYDEGFIAGILKEYTGFDFEVNEVDCWATGARTCRFTADKV